MNSYKVKIFNVNNNMYNHYKLNVYVVQWSANILPYLV